MLHVKVRGTAAGYPECCIALENLANEIKTSAY